MFINIPFVNTINMEGVNDKNKKEVLLDNIDKFLKSAEIVYKTKDFTIL